MLRIRRIAFALPLLGVAVVWFLLLRPGFLGGSASYIIVAGASMEPTLHSGDLALAREQPGYHEGDIVTFRVPEGQPGEGAIVIHRIVGGTAEEGYTIQGDNKEAPDLWRPTADDIVGRMWFSVPNGGLYLLFLREPIVLGAVAGLLGMLFVLSGGEGSQRGRRHGRTIRPGPPARPAWGMLFVGTLVVLAGCFAAVALFSFRQPIDTISEPALFSLFGLGLPVATVRWVSAVGFAVTGGAATGGLALATLFLPRRSEAARIQARYGSLITVAQADLKEDGKRILVASIEDLVKLAQRDDRMILHQELEPQSHLYFIQDGAVTYQYMVAEEGPAAEQPEKPRGLRP